MAESQQDRLEDLSGEPSGNPRRIWTDERRQAFLEVADRVGWSNHSVIAAELDLSIRQIRNYKLKFPKDRWREEGAEKSVEEESGDTSSEADNRLLCGAEMPEEESLSIIQPVPAAGSPSESSTFAAGGAELTGRAEPHCRKTTGPSVLRANR